MLERVRDLREQLPPAEAMVADVLLSQPHAFVQSPIAEIAREARVSQPTVIRFCRSMGAPGLKAFKLSLAASLQLTGRGPHPTVQATDSVPDLSAKVIGAGVQALQTLSSSLDLNALQAVVQVMRHARRVDFVGIGQSALVALDAKQKFFRFGLICEAQSDPALQVMSASQLGPGDLLVIISASGRSPELLDVARVAREQGARIVTVGAPGAPVDAFADWTLHAYAQEDPDIHLPMLGRLQHLMIIDVLAVALAQTLGDPAREKLLAMKRVLVRRRETGKSGEPASPLKVPAGGSHADAG